MSIQKSLINSLVTRTTNLMQDTVAEIAAVKKTVVDADMLKDTIDEICDALYAMGVFRLCVLHATLPLARSYGKHLAYKGENK